MSGFHTASVRYLLIILCIRGVYSQAGKGCSGVLPGLATLDTVVLDADNLASLDRDVQMLVDCMPSGGTLQFDVAEIQLAKSLVITQPLSITSGSRHVLLRCPSDGSNLINIRANDVELSKIDISGCHMKSKKAPIDVTDSNNISFTSIICNNNSNSKYGGCLSVTNSSISIDESFFLGGKASKGGSLSITNSSSVHISNCEFVNNTAEIGGGAVFISASDLTVSRSDFQHNIALDDGGAIFVESEEEARIKIVKTEFESNEIFGVYDGGNNFRAGGAVALFGSGVFCEVSEGSFVNNTSEMDGGAIAVMHGADLLVNNSTFFENAALQGGGIYVESLLPDVSNMTVFNTIFKANRASGEIVTYKAMGGAIGLFEQGVSARIEGCRFMENDGGIVGGGLVGLRVAFVDVVDSQFLENISEMAGGAMFYESTHTRQTLVHISDSVFEANSAGHSDGHETSKGGGIFVQGRSVTCLLSGANVFKGNWAMTCGGALFTGKSSHVSIGNGFFGANEALSGSGGAVCVEEWQGEATSLTMDGTIFVDNQAKKHGGGLSVTGPNANIQLHTVNFTANNAHEMGGAVAAFQVETLTTKNSTFLANSSPKGGALMCLGSQKATHLMMVHLMTTIFAENYAANSGGAIEVDGEELTVRLDDVTFISNHVKTNGGAMHVVDGAQVAVHGSLFDSNIVSEGSGGAISVQNNKEAPTMVTFSSTLFQNNTADGRFGTGGALSLEDIGVRCEISNKTLFSANGAKDVGGAVSVMFGASLTAESSSFSSNFAAQGGAIWIQSAGVKTGVLIDKSFFSANVALDLGGKGGAIGMVGIQTTLAISGSKLEANSAHETGGAISAVNATELYINENSLFSRNAAQIGAAVFVQSMETTPTTVSISDTKFERNSAVAQYGKLSHGGALQLIGNSLICSLAPGVEFVRNQASQGGAISAHNGVSLSADGVSIRENIAHNGTGGGIHFESEDMDANLVLKSSEFTNNTAHGHMSDGGALHLYGNRVSASVFETRFEGNAAVDVGGAIAAQSLSDLAVESGQFFSNQATGGGAFFAKGGSNSSNITFTGVDFQDNLASGGLGGAAIVQGLVELEFKDGTSFIGNTASAGAGAVFLGNVSSATFKDVEFHANQAVNGSGGAIYAWADDGSALLISKSSFYNNSVSKTGGAILAQGPMAAVISGLFAGNSAANGGAVAVENGTSLLISETTFTENSGDNGGALYVKGVDEYSNIVSIETTSFVNNTAIATDLSRGGAVALVGQESWSSSSVVCDIHSQCSFINNSAVFGGAISIKEAHILLDDTNFTENSAGHGGALWIQAFNQASLEIKSANFTSNTATISEGFCGAVDYKGEKLNSSISSAAIFATRFPVTASPFSPIATHNFMANVTCEGPSGNK